jgi:hypothetical protein
MEQMRNEHRQKIEEVLNEEQIAEWQAMHEEMQERKKGKHHGKKWD